MTLSQRSLMQVYDFRAIEAKWQQFWLRNQTFRVEDANSGKPKFFALIEFPYPSGAGLHVGHPRSYTALDVVVRKRRMQGYNVLYPIGWDAFGLPTENYAIKTGRQPADVTAENIATFRRQLQSLGFSFDWSREVDTTDPQYYKWTQWIFLQLFKKGLAYKANIPINWCPKDKIGLANEEVVDGSCERCGTPVEKRDKEQWMLAITKYADRLLADLDTVDYIPAARTQQTNWIGKSEGAEIDFAVADSDEKVRVFTTRPDTIFGATYMVLAPEHRLLDVFQTRIQNWSEVDSYRKSARLMKDMDRSAEGREKTGVRVEGLMAVNPATQKQIPVFIADYVLGSYGTGAIMAVPAHDQRDWEFAKKYNVPMRTVVVGEVGPVHRESPKFVGVYGIVRNADNRYLIQWDKLHLYYRLPGGTQKEGEDAVEVLQREFREETGYLEYEVGSKIGEVNAHVVSVKTKEYMQYLRSAYEVRLRSDAQEPVVHDEDKDRFEYYWMTFEEARAAFGKNPQDTGEFKLIEMAENPALIHTDQGLVVASGFLDGMTTAQAKEAVISWVEKQTIGTRSVRYKLRDWVFSRQRYWGEPIPLVHCEPCGGWVALPESALPLTLPAVDKYQPTDTGESPLSTLTDWVATTCPQCGGPARRETDTMPNWAGSSWYFLRYCAPADDAQFTRAHAWARPAIEQNDQDRQVWASYLTVRERFAAAGIEHWVCGSLALNGLNRSVWMHMGDVDIIVPPAQLDAATALVADLPLVHLGAVVEHSRPTDFERVHRCELEGVTFRMVSPFWHAQFYATREKDERDIAKREFITAYQSDATNYWMGVDWYNGGMEHTVLHLLYSRFWNKFLFDIGASPVCEPYNRRTSHGLILAKGGEKMSKSKGNVVNPDELVAQYGADTFRAYEMFMGPFDQHAQWDTDGLIGVHRFLTKFALMREKVSDVVAERDTLVLMHQTIKRVGDAIEGMRFNTAVAALMEYTNGLNALGAVPKECYRVGVQLLAPYAPHLAEELWSGLGEEGSVAYAAWPIVDEHYLVHDEVTYAVQVNGKLRAQFSIASDADEVAVREVALAEPAVQKWLEGKEPKKVIVVKGRMVSVVV